jgi:hypothetical protein
MSLRRDFQRKLAFQEQERDSAARDQLRCDDGRAALVC